MRKKISVTILILIIMGLIIFIIIKFMKPLINQFSNYRGKKIATEKKEQIYYCPMHPNYTSDKPGECPICGMNLVPKKKDTKEEIKAEKDEVFISPEKQQLIGVKTDRVRFVNFKKSVRAKGLIEYDERRLFNVTTKIEGYVDDLFINYTGQMVKKGDPLFTIYSPELVSAQQEYLLALKSKEISKDSGFPEIKKSLEGLIESARRKLKLWDITDAQIDNLEKTGNVKKSLTIYSPYSGFVVEKKVVEGMKIMIGDVLYKIADLSSVWVVADVYEHDIHSIKLGQSVQISLLSMPEKRFFSKVSYIYPYLESETRTVKVRMEVQNVDFVLKPNMYVNVEIDVNLGRRLSIDETAVIDTGERQIVILTVKKGHFKPVEVRIGSKVENYFEILEGLKEGDEVVINANFLIDSESRMKSALSEMAHAHNGVKKEEKEENKAEKEKTQGREVEKKPIGEHHH